MKSFLTAAVVAGALVVSATSAQAAVYSFTGGGYGQADSYTYGDLTVTGQHSHNSGTVHDTGSAAGQVTKHNTRGLGVDNGHNDNDEIDGRSYDDVLVFSFDSAVTFLKVTFDSAISGDDFNFFFDDDGNGSLSGDYVGSVDPTGYSYTFNGVYDGTLFGIGASGYYDDFRVVSIEAISAVPVPAALPLFGAALLGMGFLARRRKQKAALQA